jgi:pimeloyl-ACP methyl ester carboxylesterase
MSALIISKVQILGYSMGCHLAAHAAKSLRNEGLNVDVVLLVVPDPKYRKCEEDRIDNLKGVQSAYKEARTLWGIARGKRLDSPGKRLAETLVELIQQGVEVHAVASKIDAVAEWPENVEELRKATEEKGMHWWLLEDPENRRSGRSSTYRVSILEMQPLPGDESLDGGSLSEYWIHSQLDCEIILSESCP